MRRNLRGEAIMRNYVACLDFVAACRRLDRYVADLAEAKGIEVHAIVGADSPMFANGPAFGILVSAGFADIWSELHPNDLGLTWPFYTEDPVGPATPFQRIDLILVRGSNIVCKSVALTGTTPSEGLWASDHAGVIASLTLEP